MDSTEAFGAFSSGSTPDRTAINPNCKTKHLLIKAKDMKTLVINEQVRAAGHAKSLLRTATRIIRKEKLVNPSIRLIEKIIFKLEKEV
jgi:hypothetical protein